MPSIAIVSYDGKGGGERPDGQTCQLYGPPLPNGCTGEPHCTCVP